MTVAELITWLATQDQEAIVEVLVRSPATGYEGDTFYTEEFTPELAEYTDFRGNPHMKPEYPSFNKRVLRLGES